MTCPLRARSSVDGAALALTDSRSAEEILAIYNGDIGVQSPKVAAFGAVFDEQGRVLLMQREDNRLWGAAWRHGGGR